MDCSRVLSPVASPPTSHLYLLRDRQAEVFGPPHDVSGRDFAVVTEHHQDEQFFGGRGAGPNAARHQRRRVEPQHHEVGKPSSNNRIACASSPSPGSERKWSSMPR